MDNVRTDAAADSDAEQPSPKRPTPSPRRMAKPPNLDSFFSKRAPPEADTSAASSRSTASAEQRPAPSPSTADSTSTSTGGQSGAASAEQPPASSASTAGCASSALSGGKSTQGSCGASTAGSSSGKAAAGQSVPSASAPSASGPPASSSGKGPKKFVTPLGAQVARPGKGLAKGRPGGSRLLNDKERAVIVQWMLLHGTPSAARPDYSTVAQRLRMSPHTKKDVRRCTRCLIVPHAASRCYVCVCCAQFGIGTPGYPMGIQRQHVRHVWLGFKKTESLEHEQRGHRPPFLSDQVQKGLVMFLAAIVATKAVGFTALLLQPMAVGYLVSLGYGEQMFAETRRGVFSCSVKYIKRLLPKHKWRSAKPQGDARKLPANWRQLGHDMLLRLAYFVFLYSIPEELVINADHTGVFLTPAKGKAWFTEEMLKEGDKKIRGHGDKRQLTLLAASTPKSLLRSQTVSKGKTRASLPFKGLTIFILAAIMAGASTVMNGCKRPTSTACFTLDAGKATGISSDEGAIDLTGIGSWCLTSNHWSDDITSCAFGVPRAALCHLHHALVHLPAHLPACAVDDIIAPYVKQTITELQEKGVTVKPYGEQVVVLTVDAWWGWLSQRFRTHIRSKYPWIRL
eukprot:1629240-Prymnesium_polylepis.2